MGISNIGKVARSIMKFVENNHNTLGVASAVTLGISGMFLFDYLSRPKGPSLSDEFVPTLKEENNETEKPNVEKEIIGERKLTQMPTYNKNETEKISPNDRIIGGVEFQKGLVKKVEITHNGNMFDVDASPYGDKTYTVTLENGVEFDYVPQVATNKAQVYMENGELVLKGIRRMYFNNHHYSEEDKKYLYSNVGKYKFVGCQGMVNTDEIPGEQITSAHRIMPDGIKQESCLKVWDGYKKDGSSKVVGDKVSDIYILTENDSW